jgi:outer membrane protein OmpA-like peptidoglycan-associated protein
MKYSLLPLGFLSILVAAGCATVGPTAELVDARRAYEDARLSDAARYTPDKLLSAKQALDRAEAAHQDDAGSFKEKSLAYIAQRRSDLAKVYGAYERDHRERDAAQASFRQRQDDLRRTAERRASDTAANLNSARTEIAAQSSALTAEKEARMKAEQRASAAIASLNKIAQIKEESRGTVITLQGAVLFVTGKSELLPLAKDKLNDVARALKELDSNQLAVIEGYTDSRGADDANMRLSQARADAVKDYLVSQGVKAEQVRAVGHGEERPLASNDTPEGRANNRRVEIVVQPQQRGNNAGPTDTQTSTRP